MIYDIFKLIVSAAENSFLQVTAFVGAVLLIFGILDYFSRGQLVGFIQKTKRFQPIIGAFLGLTPGCGGAIFVMPMFVKGYVTYGTIIATLIATMGDAAFVLIAGSPKAFVAVSIVSFLIGIITGYIVDYFGIGIGLKEKIDKLSKEKLDKLHKSINHKAKCENCKTDLHVSNISEIHIGHEEGDFIDMALHHKAKGHIKMNSLGYQITHHGYVLYWLITLVGLILGVMLLFQLDVNNLGFKNLGLYFGVFGTIASITLLVFSKKYIQDDTHEEEEMKLKSIKETIIHNGSETAFAGSWVFVAYLVYEISIYFIGGGNYAAGEELLLTMMKSAGLWSVIIGALIGLIPGCGPQILFMALYLKGMIPFAALLANAISQDGDALFPLLAIDKRSSFWATVITTVPALIVGISYHYFVN